MQTLPFYKTFFPPTKVFVWEIMTSSRYFRRLIYIHMLKSPNVFLCARLPRLLRNTNPQIRNNYMVLYLPELIQACKEHEHFTNTSDLFWFRPGPFGIPKTMYRNEVILKAIKYT